MKISLLKYLFLICIFQLNIIGCTSTGFLMASAEVSMFGNSYTQKEENANIDIYITNTPTQEYIEFAQITCADTDDDWCIKQIQIAARKIGADGVIVIGRAGSYGAGVPVGNMIVTSNEEYGMTAIAIKYKTSIQ